MILSGIDIFLRFVQRLNAPSKIASTPSGIMTLSKDEQLLNADGLIVFKSSLKVMVSNDVTL